MEPDEDATPDTLECPSDPPQPIIELTDDDIVGIVIPWYPGLYDD